MSVPYGIVERLLHRLVRSLLVALLQLLIDIQGNQLGRLVGLGRCRVLVDERSTGLEMSLKARQ